MAQTHPHSDPEIGRELHGLKFWTISVGFSFFRRF